VLLIFSSRGLLLFGQPKKNITRALCAVKRAFEQDYIQLPPGQTKVVCARKIQIRTQKIEPCIQMFNASELTRYMNAHVFSNNFILVFFRYNFGQSWLN